MGRTVRELLDGMDAIEWQHWVAYHNLDPITEDRADLRTAQVCSTLANVMTTKGGFKPSDFMPDFTPQQVVEVDDDELLRQGMRFVAAFGGNE